MPYRIAGLDGALQNASNTRNDANLIREHIIEALNGWPEAALKAAYEIIPFNEALSNDLYNRAKGLSDVLHDYLNFHNEQFPDDHLRSIINTAVQIGY